MKQCVEFYYLWKKVCTDDYRKSRLARRRREQELYNMRFGSNRPAASDDCCLADIAADDLLTDEVGI